MIDQAGEHNPDIILTDFQMPEMDGREAAEIIKADENLKSMPIIAVTASAMKEELRAICNGFF